MNAPLSREQVELAILTVQVDAPTMVEVSRGFSSLVARFMTSTRIYKHVVDDLDGSWAGPIVPPEGTR